MSCEKNQNKTANAAGASAGIPGAANKFSYVAAGGVKQGGSKEAGAIEAAALPIEPTPAGPETRIKPADPQTVELAKDSHPQQAMCELQEKYMGLQISQTDLKKMLGAGTKYSHLVGESWIAEGPLGMLVYGQTEEGQCTLHGIEPCFGQEIELRNRLAFYSSRSPGLTAKEEKNRAVQKLNKLGRWLGAHQDELGVLVHQAFATAFTIGALRAGSIIVNGCLKKTLPGEHLQNMDALVRYVAPPRTVFSVSALSKELGYAGMMTGLAATTYLGLQRVRAARAAMQKAVEALKDPDRKKAAISLQQNYSGARVSEQELAALMGAAPVHLQANTGKVSGPLGTVYYETLASGQVSIQRILPALGQEISLQKGLDNLKEKPAASVGLGGSAVPSVKG